MNGVMKSSERLRQYLKNREKLSFTAYPDPKTGGAPWTIGYGATGPGIGPDTVWTEQECEDRFDSDVASRELVINAIVNVPLTQGQFDALVSILFNVGAGSTTRDGIQRLKDGSPSTLLRKLNAGDYDGARDEFAKWVSPGSPVERGLRIRRSEEVKGFWNV